MSSMGVWSVVAIRDEDVRRFAPLLRPLIEAAAGDPATAERYRWWAAAPERVRGFRPSPPGSRRLELNEESESFRCIPAHPLGETRAADPECAVTRCQDAYVRAVEPFVAVTRRCDPVAALFHGLGPARAAALPGFFGDFILSSDEAGAALPALRAALTFRPGAEREAATARMRDWLFNLGDADQEPDELFGGLLPCWEHAVRLGLGLSGVTEHF
jgi:hypothetical protein